MWKRTIAGTRSDSCNYFIRDKDKFRFQKMSQTRIKTVSSRSFLHTPIEYRQVTRHRHNHESVRETSPPNRSQYSQAQTPKHSVSRLQQLLGGRSRRPSRNISFSLGVSNKTRPTRIDQTSTLKNNIKKADCFSQRNQTQAPLVKNLPQINTATGRVNSNIGDRNNLSKAEVNRKVSAGSPQPVNFSPFGIIAEEGSWQHLDQKLEELIGRKLQLVLEQTSRKQDLSESVARLKKESINEELQVLLHQIRRIKSKEAGGDMDLMNKKIRFIENVMAEQITESELMKKYYYNLSSNKKKGKIGDFNHLKTKVSAVFANQKQPQRRGSPVDGRVVSKAVFQDSTSKHAYKEPRLQDYESYRYKHKKVALNLQPLPRSSYKREYFYMKTQPDEMIINRDHSPYNPLHKAKPGSTYDKDFTSLRSDRQDFRQLDAYHNKIKVLKVNYMPRNRVDTISYDRDTYARDVEMSGSRSRSPDAQLSGEKQSEFHRQMMVSESRRQFKKVASFEPSKIKHRQLQDLQYRLKNIFKA